MKRIYLSTILTAVLTLATVCFTGLIAQAAPAPQSYRNIFFEYNTQHPGGDYTNFPTPNFQACAEACANERRCRAMSYNINNHICELKDRVSPPQPNPVIASGVKQENSNSGAQGGHGNNNQGGYGNNNQGSYNNNGQGGYGNNNQGGYGNNNQGSYNNNGQGGYSNYGQGGHENNTQNTVYGIQLYDNVKRNGGDYKNFRVANVEECAKVCSRDRQCRSFNFGKAKRDCWLKNSIPGGVPNNTVVSGVKR